MEVRVSKYRELVRGDRTDELIATVAILRADAIPVKKLTPLLEYIGSAVDLLPLELGGAELDVRPMLVSALSGSEISSAEEEVRAWEQAGYQVRTVLDPEYPANLQTIFDKPPFVFLLGRWEDRVHSKALAVVGTRSASPDGCKRAYRLARDLARSGGIDTYAHRGALDGSGPTVAVMGTGMSRRYPAENARLADEIVQNRGVLLSQFFPNQPPTKWSFPVRNLTMSGLSLATIVIEAGATSGARIQAEAALVHGRPVFLPSSLVSSHEWAREMVDRGYEGVQAIEVSSADELLDRLVLSPEADALVA
jgi:DNA processing protein